MNSMKGKAGKYLRAVMLSAAVLGGALLVVSKGKSCCDGNKTVKPPAVETIMKDASPPKKDMHPWCPCPADAGVADKGAVAVPLTEDAAPAVAVKPKPKPKRIRGPRPARRVSASRVRTGGSGRGCSNASRRSCIENTDLCNAIRAGISKVSTLQQYRGKPVNQIQGEEVGARVTIGSGVTPKVIVTGGGLDKLQKKMVAASIREKASQVRTNDCIYMVLPPRKVR